jgi:hypothetical protein
MKKLSILTSLILLFFTTSLYSQDETKNNIPELEDFHEIIYPIWHTFYPAKDYKSLRDITTELNTKAEKIYNVKLPGILREKSAKWNAAVKDLKLVVNNFNDKAKGKDDKELLDAAEKLHSNYEKLIRIINPDLKEAEEFHQILYTIYHKYFPEKDYANISLLTDKLILKAEAITNAKLPKQFESKSAPFKIAANNLLTSVKELKLVSAKSDNIGMDQAVEKMHSNYEKLNQLFTN